MAGDGEDAPVMLMTGKVLLEEFHPAIAAALRRAPQERSEVVAIVVSTRDDIVVA